MTPEQKIKQCVLAKSAEWAEETLPVITADNVEDLYFELTEQEAHWDAVSELRQGEVETDLPCKYSRHYESKSVAMKTPDGSWVGWTYWFGGGKHGQPDSIDWMNAAYDLDCKEEEKTVVVLTFRKKEKA